MGFTTIGVLAGLLVGLATGGRFHHIGARSFRWWWLLPVGLVAQVVAEWAEVPGRLGLVVLSYGALVAFAAANLRHIGMGVALVGLGLNALVILVNGGMPVRAEAIVAADIADSDELDTLEFGAKRHLENPTDELTFLGDIIPVAPLREVLSFGDLILMFGVADVVAWLLHPARHRTKRGHKSDVVLDLTQVEQSTVHHTASRSPAAP